MCKTFSPSIRPVFWSKSCLCPKEILRELRMVSDGEKWSISSFDSFGHPDFGQTHRFQELSFGKLTEKQVANENDNFMQFLWLMYSERWWNSLKFHSYENVYWRIWRRCSIRRLCDEKKTPAAAARTRRATGAWTVFFRGGLLVIWDQRIDYIPTWLVVWNILCSHVLGITIQID